MSHTQQKHKQYLSSTNSQHTDWFCKESVTVKSLPKAQSRLAGTTVKAESHNEDELLISLYVQPVGWEGPCVRIKRHTPALSQNLCRGNACAVKLVSLERLAKVILIHFGS